VYLDRPLQLQHQQWSVMETSFKLPITHRPLYQN